MSSRAVETYCAEHGIDAEFIETNTSTKTAKDAARVLKVGKEQIIKSLVFYVDEAPYLIVVQGPDRVDTDRLQELMEAETCRLAQPDEVKQETGYTVGGVPPVGLELPKIVDEAVLTHEKVYGGGGSKHCMIGLDPRFIIDENDLVGSVTA